MIIFWFIEVALRSGLLMINFRTAQARDILKAMNNRCDWHSAQKIDICGMVRVEVRRKPAIGERASPGTFLPRSCGRPTRQGCWSHWQYDIVHQSSAGANFLAIVDYAPYRRFWNAKRLDERFYSDWSSGTIIHSVRQRLQLMAISYHYQWISRISLTTAHQLRSQRFQTYWSRSLVFRYQIGRSHNEISNQPQ